MSIRSAGDRTKGSSGQISQSTITSAVSPSSSRCHRKRCMISPHTHARASSDQIADGYGT